jgi:hypothetical protein
VGYAVTAMRRRAGKSRSTLAREGPVQRPECVGHPKEPAARAKKKRNQESA